MGRQATQYFRQPLQKVCSRSFTFLYHCIEDSGSFSGIRRTDEQTVLAANRYRADGSLHLVVVNGDTGITQPAAELLLPFQGIVYGILQLVARRILCIESSFGKFLEEVFYNRCRFFQSFL